LNGLIITARTIKRSFSPNQGNVRGENQAQAEVLMLLPNKKGADPAGCGEKALDACLFIWFLLYFFFLGG